MRIKIAHVTNSSSASFMIPKSCLTEEQIMKIRDHIETANYLMKKDPDEHDFGHVSEESEWNITETDNSIQGYTGMDNFYMSTFLNAIDIKNEEIHYEHDG